MKKLSILLSACILIGSVLFAWHLIQSRAAAPKRPDIVREMLVNVQVAQLTDYKVVLKTSGEVRARTETTLIPEVSGKVEEISPTFREGGFFEKDELLIRLNSDDYAKAVTIAKGQLASAMTMRDEEKVRAEMAVEEWKRLGRTGEPGALAARKPQAAEAEAKVQAAQAQLERADLDLQRTKILAPYAGRVLTKSADVGQYVGPGRELGEIYAVDYAEVRLPLNNEQLAFIDLPEHYRNEPAPDLTNGPKVTLQASVAGTMHQWEGTIARAAGSIDSRSRQLYITVQVKDPYAKRAEGTPPLKVGQWVDAEIPGKTLSQVFLIPRSAVREGDLAIIVDADNTLRYRPIERLWGEGDDIVAAGNTPGGIKPGDLFCTSAMSFIVEGTRVKPFNPESEKPAPADPASSPTATPPLQTGSPAEAKQKTS